MSGTKVRAGEGHVPADGTDGSIGSEAALDSMADVVVTVKALLVVGVGNLLGGEDVLKDKEAMFRVFER